MYSKFQNGQNVEDCDDDDDDDDDNDDDNDDDKGNDDDNVKGILQVEICTNL